LATGHLLAQTAQSNPPRSANDRMLEAGPEAARLASRSGIWDVVMTLRPTAEAAPVVVKDLVAERTMIGPYLQEIMRPAAGSSVADFHRIEYLTYNRVEARWQYVSMDTRVPIGLMTATSAADEPLTSITVYFENFAIPGFGPEVEGRFFRARHQTTRESDDRDITRQFWSSVGNPSGSRFNMYIRGNVDSCWRSRCRRCRQRRRRTGRFVTSRGPARAADLRQALHGEMNRFQGRREQNGADSARRSVALP
jgi:hypothetical protein